MITVDNESPAGAWRRDWDAQSHTTSEYREKIRELRKRNEEYAKQLEAMQLVIDDLREEINLIHKHIYGRVES